MEIGPLLVEQRRVGDEFRIVEAAVQQMHKTLAGRHLDAATRSQIEAFVDSTTSKLIQLGRRRLDLDAAVPAADARSLESSREDLGVTYEDQAMSEDTVRLSQADLDGQLDEALKDSFPASDPVTLGQPSSTGPDRPLNRRPAALDTELVNELARNVEAAHEVSLAASDEKADLQGSQRRATAVAEHTRQQAAPCPAVRNRNAGNVEQRALSNAVSDLDSRD